MKTLPHLATALSLLFVLSACSSLPEPTVTSQATQVLIPTDLAFSAPLVQALSQAGLAITTVQGSTYASMFATTHRAVGIETNAGIVEAVFFADPAEAARIHITEQLNGSDQRHRYTIQASPPTLPQDQIIDADSRMYFTINQNMLLITSSPELDKTLKQLFSGR